MSVSMYRLCIFLSLFTVFTLAGCHVSRPTAYVIINNESVDRTPVNMSIALHDRKTGKDILQQTTIQPGLQFIPGKKYKKGTYNITVGANDGALNIKHPITLDTDRWIIINYTLGDSANIMKTYGYLDTASHKKINGRYANLDMYVEYRRPPNL